MLPNHHLSKPVFIGEIQADGQFNIVWKTPGGAGGELVEVHPRERQPPPRLRARDRAAPGPAPPLPKQQEP